MTLTIVARNPFTRQLGVAIASGSDDCAGGSLYMAEGRGIVSVQAKGDKHSGMAAVGMMMRGIGSKDILSQLRAHDNGISQRQILIAPLDGDLTVFTGDMCLTWAGHIAKEHLLLAGNMLLSDQTLAGMEKAYMKDMHAPMRQRLLYALGAGIATGGDVRGHRSAGIIVTGGQPFELRVTNAQQPLEQLLAGMR